MNHSIWEVCAEWKSAKSPCAEEISHTTKPRKDVVNTFTICEIVPCSIWFTAICITLIATDVMFHCAEIWKTEKQLQEFNVSLQVLGNNCLF